MKIIVDGNGIHGIIVSTGIPIPPGFGRLSAPMRIDLERKKKNYESENEKIIDVTRIPGDDTEEMQSAWDFRLAGKESLLW